MKFNQSEEQIMKYLWKLDTAYMKDLVEEFPNPKPAYTTVATMVTRMIKKGYIGFTQRGSVREYYPKIRKADYFSGQLKTMMKDFFNNSAAQFGSFFAKKTELSVDQLEELKRMIEEEIAEKRKET
ncbi:MAG: penicillinase repressor [Flammeovirgaceae bacterium]|nr:penicillinase repressor [Flammeovirgaceae bacterium]MBE60753.1 penicillinase repressor [Flammeovirgaceae bacterium]|tara:strand:+ start:389 stop:766 length:378 start_codon:yes stop_codon:yes gene_type:complete